MGLMLASCSENQKKRMLENCADEKMIELFGGWSKLKQPLKEKLRNDNYYVVFGSCQKELKTHGIRFKEKYK